MIKHLFVLVLLALALTGCVTDGSTQSLKPVCEALGPPHSYTRTTGRPTTAGPVLANRLARDNAVGEGLPCPGY